MNGSMTVSLIHYDSLYSSLTTLTGVRAQHNLCWQWRAVKSIKDRNDPHYMTIVYAS